MSRYSISVRCDDGTHCVEPCGSATEMHKRHSEIMQMMNKRQPIDMRFHDTRKKPDDKPVGRINMVTIFPGHVVTVVRRIEDEPDPMPDVDVSGDMPW